MARKQKIPTLEEIRKRFEAGYSFNQQIKLYETVKVNEDFFIGNQWNGVESNGLPTPVFNMFKRDINYQVATVTSDNMAIQAVPMPSTSRYTTKQLDQICEVVNHQIVAIMEREKIVAKNREFIRNAAVTGDGCMHFYFDPTVENGQEVKGEIKAEILDNLRVMFGNPNCRDVQRQPYIIISKRELVDDVQWHVEDLKDMGKEDKETYTRVENPEDIRPDSEKFQNDYDSYTDDKVTVLTYYYRNRETGTIWCIECTERQIIREAYDTELTRYPLIWINWDYIRDCYHGQAEVTGMIPNQKYINKMFAMVSISTLTTSFPKYIYDRTKIKHWSGDVGTAIGVTGNVGDAAKVIEGASVSPQIAQFIEMSFDKTNELLGVSDVVSGNARPDNTSAIISLQRAANTPLEMVKQQDYQCMEDAARIWIDMMATYYGTRMVEVSMDMDKPGEQPLGMELPAQSFMVTFDFARLREVQLSIKQDVGASSYWSEMANVQTLENLMMNDRIDTIDFLERLPSGYLTKKQELIEKLKAKQMTALPAQGMNTGTDMSMETTANNMEIHPGSGNGALQRALNREGA